MFYLRKWNDIITEVQCFHTDSISSQSYSLHLIAVIIIMLIFVQRNLKLKARFAKGLGDQDFGTSAQGLGFRIHFRMWHCRDEAVGIFRET